MCYDNGRKNNRPIIFWIWETLIQSPTTTTAAALAITTFDHIQKYNLIIRSNTHTHIYIRQRKATFSRENQKYLVRYLVKLLKKKNTQPWANFGSIIFLNEKQ